MLSVSIFQKNLLNICDALETSRTSNCPKSNEVRWKWGAGGSCERHEAETRILFSYIIFHPESENGIHF